MQETENEIKEVYSKEKIQKKAKIILLTRIIRVCIDKTFKILVEFSQV